MVLSIIMVIYYFHDTGQPSLLFQDNHVDWAPSLHLGHGAVHVSKASVERYDRALRRDNTKRQSQPSHTETEGAKRQKGVEAIGNNTNETTDTTTTDSYPETTGEDTNETTETTTTDSVPETVLTVNEMDSLTKLEVDMKELKQTYTRLEEENAVLRVEKKELQEKSKELNEDFLEMLMKKVRYYTGLTNWNLLMIAINFVQPFLSTHHRNALSPFQKVILTLMRLRLGLSVQDLGYRFGIYSSTVSRTFSTVIDILHEGLKHLILLPERDALTLLAPRYSNLSF